MPSNNAPGKIKSAVDFTKPLTEVRQSYRAKYYSAKSKVVVDLQQHDLLTNNNTSETDPPEKIIIIPTHKNENVTQKSKSAVHTWRKGTTGTPL